MSGLVQSLNSPFFPPPIGAKPGRAKGESRITCMRMLRAPPFFPPNRHSRSQRPRSFWSAPKIATSGHVQHRKSAIHRLPVTLRMLRVKSDKSDWFWSQSIVFTKPFKNGMSMDRARGRDSWCWPKGAWPLGTRMPNREKIHICKYSPDLTCGAIFWMIIYKQAVKHDAKDRKRICCLWTQDL